VAGAVKVPFVWVKDPLRVVAPEAAKEPDPDIVRLLRVFPALVRVTLPVGSKFKVDPVAVRELRLVRFMLPDTVRVLFEISRALVPAPATEKFPFRSRLSASVRDPAVPSWIFPRPFPAEVRDVVPSKTTVDPVEVKVSAFVRLRVAPA